MSLMEDWNEYMINKYDEKYEWGHARCSECHVLPGHGHKMSCSKLDRSGFDGQARENRISGNAAQVYHLGYQASYFDVPMMSHVVGRLWQGGTIPGAKIDDDFVKDVSLYPWGKIIIGDNTERVEFTAYDSADGVDESIIMAAVGAVEDGLTRGKVYLRCQAGLNRSGLVAGVVLVRQGMPVEDALQLLRKRHRLVLCNATFEKQLKEGNWGEGPKWLDVDE